MPDAQGRFKGIAVPDVPWHREANVPFSFDEEHTIPDEELKRKAKAIRRAVAKRGDKVIEITTAARETR